MWKRAASLCLENHELHGVELATEIKNITHKEITLCTFNWSKQIAILRCRQVNCRCRIDVHEYRGCRPTKELSLNRRPDFTIRLQARSAFFPLWTGTWDVRDYSTFTGMSRICLGGRLPLLAAKVSIASREIGLAFFIVPHNLNAARGHVSLL